MRVKKAVRNTMTHLLAQKKMREYLKTHYIGYSEYVEKGVTQFLMTYKVKNTPDGLLEACIWFHPRCMECRVYFSSYCAMFIKGSRYLNGFMRLLNYINARIWPHTDDRYGSKLYESSYLYTPRIYMMEDGSYDVTMTTLIHYDIYEMAGLETEDFITLTCPELLDELSVPMFGIISGQMSLDEAITYINRSMLGWSE